MGLEQRITQKSNSSVSILFFIVFIGLVYFVYGTDILSVFSNKSYHTNDITEYGQWTNHYQNEFDFEDCGLYLFPSDISTYKDISYQYFAQSNIMWESQNLIFTLISYDRPQFEAERERLSKVHCLISSGIGYACVENSVRFDLQSFSYPAYVAIYCCNNSYEYALLDEEQLQIAYVYMKNVNPDKYIDAKYLPKQVTRNDYYSMNSWNNFNLYFIRTTNNDMLSYTGKQILPLR